MFLYRTSTQCGKSSPRTHPIAPPRPKKKRKIEMDPFEEEILHQLKQSNKLPQSESNDEDLFIWQNHRTEPKKATATAKSSSQNKNTSAVV